MLLDTMTLAELKKETLEEKEQIFGSSTMKRLSGEYMKERKKHKVKNNDIWRRFYEIKTKRKNNFIIAMSKQLGTVSIVDCVIYVWYNSQRGVRVISIDAVDGVLIFNSHVFKRWNERLGLGIVNPFDTIRSFFTKNDDIYFRVLVDAKGEKTSDMFGPIDGGFLLGEYHDKRLSVIKTFINRELAGQNQLDYEKDIKKYVDEYNALNPVPDKKRKRL
jgi:hypothetical protein